MFWRRNRRSNDSLVTVLVTGDRVAETLGRSLLDDACIHYVVDNAVEQDLFGFGRLGGGQIITGPAVFRVPRQDAAVASDLLKNFSEVKSSRIRSKVAILILLWFFVIPAILTLIMMIHR